MVVIELSGWKGGTDDRNDSRGKWERAGAAR